MKIWGHMDEYRVLASLETRGNYRAWDDMEKFTKLVFPALGFHGCRCCGVNIHFWLRGLIWGVLPFWMMSGVWVGVAVAVASSRGRVRMVNLCEMTKCVVARSTMTVIAKRTGAKRRRTAGPI